MLRLIKFWGNYSDTVEFSNCSTYYEVLPVVYDDTATEREIIELCLSNDIAFKGKVEVERHSHGIDLKHAVELVETKLQDSGVYIRGEIKSRKVYLGLVTIPDSDALPLYDGVDKLVTKDQAYEIVNLQECSVDNTCEINGEYTLVMEGWDYYHAIRMLGYSRESFERQAGIDGRTFADEVTSCSGCGEYMYETDGYNYKYRIVECELLGLECGCYEERVLNDIEEFIDNSSKAIELNIAEQLADKNKLKFVERYIGGWVDGRGGSFNGESTREGDPKRILASLKAKNPKRSYVFSHDESGQFQTYFSVWQVKA